ncbi:DUF2809 domain-containing protein [Terriglobus sp.]|uniref:ribosomal maturation YjgA family protein n=1 Tax=Terriglobus sp. TaxID=1889013 RepID=UPI003B00621D
MKQARVEKTRPLTLSVLLLLVTPVLGIAIRFAHMGLPWSFRKYGGSVLWAMMIYWLVSTLLPRVRLIPTALLAEAVAVAVEFLKRLHTPALEHFRGTLAGVLLLGREFSNQDIVAYSIAITCAATVDAKLRGRLASPTS